MQPEFRVLWFALVLTAAVPAGGQTPVISEVMAASSALVQDEDGDSPDWLELYNPGSEACTLTGWSLTDDPDEPGKWRFPATNLLANARMIVFASGKDRAVPGAPLHTNFKLAASGGLVALFLSDGITLVNRLNYPSQHVGFSFGVGRELDPAPLVGLGTLCRVLVPTNDPGAPWYGANEPFDDQGWMAATNSIGFDQSESGNSGLLGWWNFDDASNSTLARDVAGGNHHCMLSGGPSFTADAGGHTGRHGDRALDCGGVGYGRVADAATGMFDTATAHDAISLSLWVSGGAAQPQNGSVFYAGSNADGSGTRSLNAHLPWSDSVIYWDTSGCCDPSLERVSVAEPDSTKWKGRWNHYAFVKRGNLKEIWQNGRLLYQGINAAKLSSIRSFYIGAFAANNAYIGLIDDFAVWDVALTEAQIQALATGATPTDIDRLSSLITTDIGSSMFNRSASLLLRVAFSGPELPGLDQLILRVNFDDGVFCWLNGAAMAGRNAPVALAYNSAATADRPNQAVRQAEEIDLSHALHLVHPGTNYLALQGLNVAATNADFLLAFELWRGRSRPNMFFSTPTPGAPNGPGLAGVVDAPKLDPSGGLYAGPLDVSIITRTPGAVLVYTTNGTTPSLSNGVLCPGTNTTVHLDDTRLVRAGAFRSGFEPSATRSASYILLHQVARQARPSNVGTTWPGGHLTDFAMDSRVINNALPGYGLDEALLDIPSLAIVMPPVDLWDYNTGIYANSTVEMEREGSVEMLFPDHSAGFQESAGIAIRGQSSAYKEMTPKHSFTITFRSEFGVSKLQFPVFPDSAIREFNSLVLRGNVLDSWVNSESAWNHLVDGELRWYRTRGVYVRNQWMNDSLHAQGQPAAYGRFVHLFLNGFYWGIYNLLERLDEQCAAFHLGGSASEYDVIADQELRAGTLDAWNLLMTRAGSDLSLDSNYQRLMGNNADGSRNPNYPVLVDITNLVDYMVLHIYAGADDWPWHNWVAFRRRGPESTGFKFLAWDQEISINSLVKQHTDGGQLYAEVDAPNSAAYVYSRCRANAEFRQFFADRVQRHMFNGGALCVSSNIARYDTRVAEIDNAIVAESARWGDFYRPELPYTREAEWLGTNQWMRQAFFPSNHFIALQRFRNAGLFPAVLAPNFRTPGGAVPLGFALELTNPNKVGTLYFTTNGPDPRRRAGGIDPAAGAYSAAIPIRWPTLVRARVLSAGQWSPLVEATFYPPQDFRRLAVSEIMYDPPGSGSTNGSEYEFLELKNTGAAVLGLSGLAIGGGVAFTFTNGTSLAPQGFLLLARNPAAFATRYPGVKVDGVFSGKLDNAGDRLTLTDPLGQILMDISYRSQPPWPLAARGFGFSLVPNTGTLQPRNATYWRASANPGGSPGADDPAPQVLPVHVNEVLANPEGAEQDTIELQNPNSAAIDIAGWLLTDDPDNPGKYSIPENTVIPPFGFAVFYGSQFNSTPGIGNSFGLSARGEQVCLFSANTNGILTGYSHGFSFGAAAPGVTFGRYLNKAGEEQFPAQRSVTPGETNSGALIGPVVITEVLEQPAAGMDEFVELQNVTPATVDLFDPVRPENTWRLAGLEYSFPPNLSLAPGAILLLVATNPASFRSKHEIAGEVVITGPYGGTLRWVTSGLALQRPGVPDLDGVPLITVDQLDYRSSPDWPWPGGNGHSLQKLAAADYGNDPFNWRFAAPTPGHAFATADTDADGLPDEWEITQGTDPLSPDADADLDGDGHNNWQEYVSGTSPQDPLQALRLEQVTLLESAEGLALAFSFQLQSNRVYSIISSENPSTGDWTLLRAIPAESANRRVVVTNLLSSGSHPAFFRLSASRNPD